MPPRQKSKPIEFDGDAIIKTNEPITLTSGLPEYPFTLQQDTLVGKFVNIVINGQCRYKNSEVLEQWGDCLKLRTDLRSIGLSEITLVPWSAIEGVGIVGAR